MSTAMPELRTPVMIMVDALWQDQSGTLQKTRACMEDKSAGGACIRFKTPIMIGTTMRVQWRFEQFSGTVKYCRPDGREYLIGIQRQYGSEAAVERDVQGGARRWVNAGDEKNNDDKSTQVWPIKTSVLGGKADSVTVGEPSKVGDVGAGYEQTANTALLQAASLMTPPPRRAISEGASDAQAEVGDGLKMQDDGGEGSREAELCAAGMTKGKEADKGRKSMTHKWLGLSPWNKQDDTAAAGDNRARSDESMNGGESRNGVSAKENFMHLPQSAQTSERVGATSAREVPAFQIELLPMEDIYRMAGIASPRKGYSVTKVVEMLHSEHVRELSKEAKRAALLMALDAAGVSIEQVQRDAKTRQSALDSYEAEQRKQAEAEWTRKAEEISHIQAELESIKAHYTARISRNMEALARDKARFNSWVTAKEQESQNMAEAVDLCLELPTSEPASATLHESGMAAGGKAQ
jgi:hypothetical protein